MNWSFATLCTLVLSSVLSAQAAKLASPAKQVEAGAESSRELLVGWRRHRFAPAKPRGPRLSAVVCYPREVDEEKGGVSLGRRKEPEAEIARREGGYPVIVFLHGFGGSGGQVLDVGRRFAQAGYIAVLTDTTRFDRDLQAENGRAFFRALTLSNTDEESFLFGLLDMDRVGIGGHSMGGGNSLRVLADNPGYKAGFCFAPWMTHRPGEGGKDYVDQYASKVKVPLGIVHGVRDRILPWKLNALRLFEAAKSDASLKVLWVLDRDASHVNIAIRRDRREKSLLVFDRCLHRATAFFDAAMRGKSGGLERILDAEDKQSGVVQMRSNR